ncbi:SO2930 family diheme c-type cytochrome [Myxococcaceae bacterium GXIMD 01537]
MGCRKWLWLALGALTVACGGDTEGQGPCSGPPADYLTNPPQQLSAWCLVGREGGAVVALGSAVPYTLNTPLFSDYTVKYRTLWLPAGARAEYRASGALELPVGSVVTKTFSYPKDLRRPGEEVRVMETRVLVRTDAGWVGMPYVWNAEGTDATHEPAGGFQDVQWTSAAGQTQGTSYLVPNKNQCKKCHANGSDEKLHLLGPTAAQLNRDFTYPEGKENQLARLTRLGLLSGAPAPAEAPRMAMWDDPSTGTVAERARAYLDANCAHCHSEAGPARTSGLYLSIGHEDMFRLGVCKSPVAAGAGSGGYAYDIVPGKPENSILTHRLTSNDPKVAMPELGRSVVHEEGLALIQEWIRTLPGSCP